MDSTPPPDRNTVLTANWPLVCWAGRQAARMTGGRLPVDEATAEVACLAVLRFPKYDPARGRLSTWILFIARSVANQFQKRAGLKCRDAARERGGFDFARFVAPADRADSPGDLAAYLGPKLAAALDALPPRQRACIVARYGLDGQGERTLADIDPTVSREANRQRVLNAVRSLRLILTGRRITVGGEIVELNQTNPRLLPGQR